MLAYSCPTTFCHELEKIEILCGIASHPGQVILRMLCLWINLGITSSTRDPPTTDVRVLNDSVSVIPGKDSQVKRKWSWKLWSWGCWAWHHDSQWHWLCGQPPIAKCICKGLLVTLSALAIPCRVKIVMVSSSKDGTQRCPPFYAPSPFPGLEKGTTIVPSHFLGWTWSSISM